MIGKYLDKNKVLISIIISPIIAFSMSYGVFTQRIENNTKSINQYKTESKADIKEVEIRLNLQLKEIKTKQEQMFNKILKIQYESLNSVNELKVEIAKLTAKI